MIVTRGSTAEREPVRPQVHVGLVLHRRPLRRDLQCERPRDDVLEREALDGDVRRMPNREGSSTEVLDVAARKERHRNLIPWSLAQHGGR